MDAAQEEVRTSPLDRHWEWSDRIWGAPASERDRMIAEELEEFAAGLRDGTVHAEGSPRWTDHMGARGNLSLDFTRNPAQYEG